MPDCHLAQSDGICQLKRTLVTTDEPNEAFVSQIRGLLDDSRWNEVISVILEFVEKCRIAKPRLLIAALALCVTYDWKKPVEMAKTRRAITSQLMKFCPIPSSLFMLLKFESEYSPKQKVSFSRSKRDGISRWYNSKSPRDLAMTVTKYRRRCHWSHTDLLRLAHVRPANKGVELVLKYVTKGMEAVTKYMEEGDDKKPEELTQVYEYLKAVETVKKSHDEHVVARLVEEHRLMREHVPTWMMKSKEVWTALLQHMPLLAMIKNLNNLGVLGLLDSGNCVQLVTERLHNENYLREAKIHPLNILLAMKAYERGRLDKASKNQWKVNPEVVRALDAAFYKSFGAVERTNKNYLLAIDAGESMHYDNVLGCGLVSPLVASAAMALILARTEPTYQVVALTSCIEPLKVSSTDSLPETCTAITALKTRGIMADCSRPMLWAADTRKEVDVFVVYTDQRGGAPAGSDMTPMKALNQYCDTMGRPNTRLVVVTLTSPETALVDINDSRILHLAGFDTATPDIIRSFAMGELDSALPG
jgi:60 kDa SS-A/Ro ribonucleoprotein